MEKLSFIQYEMKSGDEKLAEALFLRGFFVELEHGIFSLKNGSKQDVKELKWFLDQCAIPVIWIGESFQLLVNHLPVEKVSEMIHFKGQNHMTFMQPYHFKWRAFVNRRFGVRISTVKNCPYTVVLAKALNEAGITTLCGCNGHEKHQPNFKLSGIYNGIWFSIVQEKYLSNLKFHYRWKIKYNKSTNTTYIIADKRKGEYWEMMKVLADCEKMAKKLLNHAAEIRLLKRNSFKRNMKEMAEKMKLAEDHKGLYNWMKEQTEKTLLLKRNVVLQSQEVS